MIDFDLSQLPLSEHGVKLFGEDAGAMFTVWEIPGWRKLVPGNFLGFLDTPRDIGKNWLAAYPVHLMEGLYNGLDFISREGMDGSEKFLNRELSRDQLIVVVITSWARNRLSRSIGTTP